ncbi:hypothetical protein [Nocardia seriolae]|nr:hypothetical protein [Nocardia seriolae]BAW04789.1 conserved hypothetical protein [Nocardia seriolae]
MHRCSADFEPPGAPDRMIVTLALFDGDWIVKRYSPAPGLGALRVRSLIDARAAVRAMLAARIGESCASTRIDLFIEDTDPED